MIGCCALLQLLLGNMGRPGGGIMALRGHASIQGSTDVPTLYHSIHGYMEAPSALKDHGTLREYLATEADGDQLLGQHAQVPDLLYEIDVRRRGHPGERFRLGLAPQDHRRSLPSADVRRHGRWPGEGDDLHRTEPRDLAQRRAGAEGDAEARVAGGEGHLPHRDGDLLESLARGQRGEVKPEDVQTEVFFFPASQVAETEGSFTNTQRMLQWHFKAAEAPGQCRTDLWFTHQLALRLKKLYADSELPRDQGFQNLTWDFDPDPGSRGQHRRASRTPTRCSARSMAT